MGPYGPQPGPGPKPDWAPTRPGPNGFDLEADLFIFFLHEKGQYHFFIEFQWSSACLDTDPSNNIFIKFVCGRGVGWGGERGEVGGVGDP